jgi:hypothetical protein
MKPKMSRRAFGLFLAVALFAPGCGGPPAPADPARARAALRDALDAWRNRAGPDALKERQPPVTVTDREWRAGYKLLSYKIESDEPFAADLRCRVQLSLRDPRGKALRKTAVYFVGTSPVLTVAREEEP